MKEELINALHTAVLREAQGTACGHVRIHVDLHPVDEGALSKAVEEMGSSSTLLDVDATVFVYNQDNADASVYEAGYSIAVESRAGEAKATIASSGGICPCCVHKKWRAKAQQAIANFSANEDASKFAAMALSLMNQIEEEV